MRIAVVGSGISGLAAAWLLARDHAVTLYEAGDYLGGHTHTVDVTLDGATHGVDTGFLVFNRATYPNLVPMLEWLGIPVAPSEMTFSLALQDPAIEWAGTSLGSLFAQRSNLVRPSIAKLRRAPPEWTPAPRRPASQSGSSCPPAATAPSSATGT
jgi:uncharacterized protein